MSARETADFDILVLGGGIVGLSVAAQLAPERRVAVLEREPALCYHTSGRSSAMFAPNYSVQSVRALTAASAAFYLDPPAPFARTVFTRRPILHVARWRARARLAHLIASAAKGAVFERLSGPAVRRHWPSLRGDFADAVLEHRCGDLDVAALAEGLCKTLRACDARIVSDLGETDIARAQGQWRVSARAGLYRAPILINAAGAWADEVARAAGVAPRGLMPLRRTVALVEPPPDPALAARPTVFDIEERFYFRPFGGAVLVTACDETPSAPCDAAPTEEDVARAVAAYDSAVAQAVRRVKARWAGLRTFAADRAPVLGPAPDAPDFYWAAGLGGFGIQTAPAVGELIAGLILGGGLRPRLAGFGVDPRAFDPARPALQAAAHAAA